MKVLLQGEIEYMPLPDLLQWTEMNRKSCVLKIDYDGTSSSLFMEDGHIIYASSQKIGRRLTDFMIQNGIFQESMLPYYLEESRKSGKFFTQYLIDDRHVSPKDLTSILSQMVDSILTDIFISDSGAFSASSPLPESVLNGPVRLSTGALVLDSLHKRDDRERNRKTKDDSLERIHQKLLIEDFQLPVLPTMISQLMTVIENEQSSMRDMAKVIMTDQVVISSILKVANSALYAASGQIDSIYMAIARLGMKEIMRIVTAIKVSSLKIPNVPRERLQKLLDDALQTALISYEFAQRLRLDPEEAFLSGLLHDLGETVILGLASDCKIEEGLLDEFIAEQHAEIGALIARKWCYPEAIQNIIRHHHDPMVADTDDRILTVLQVADSIIKSGEEWQCTPDALLMLNLSQDVLLDVYNRSMDAFAHLKSFELAGK